MAPMLLDTVRADLEAVPGQEGWFQLTGRGLVRAVAFEEFLEGCKAGVDHPVAGARVLGFHDQEAIVRDDERFNGQSAGSFLVIQRHDGACFMVLDVHLAEATLLRFILPASQPDRDDPLPRVEPLAVARPTRRNGDPGGSAKAPKDRRSGSRRAGEHVARAPPLSPG